MRQKLAEDGIDVETSAVGAVLNYKWQTIRDEKGTERLLNRTESRPYFEYNIYDENDNIIKQYTLGDKETAKVRLITEPRQLPKGNKYIAKDGWQLSDWDNPNSRRQSTLYLLEGEDDGYIYSFGDTDQGYKDYPLEYINGRNSSVLEKPNS